MPTMRNRRRRQRFTPPGLVGDWVFDGLASQRRGSVLDRSVNGNHGTVYGAPALSFDAAADDATVDTPWDSLGGHRYAWLAMWFYVSTDGSPAERELFLQTFSGAEDQIVAYLTTADKLRFAVRGASTDTQRTWESTDAVSQAEWHCLLVSIDSTDDTISTWLDGVALESKAMSGAVSAFATDTPAVQAFGWYTGDDYVFDGKMACLGFSGMDAAPTLADAEHFYDHPYTWLAAAGLDAYWYCNEGTGAAVDNAEGTAGRDLTLTGASWDVTANLGQTWEKEGGAGDRFTVPGMFFDGDDDYISVANDTSLIFGTGDFAVAVWAAISTNQGKWVYAMIAGKGDYAASEWRFFFYGGKLYFQGYETAVNISSTTTDLHDGVLRLYGVTRVGDITQLYINGAADGDPDDASGSPDDYDTAKAFQIGDADTSGDVFEGTIKSVMVLKGHGLTAREMAALYKQG